MNERWLSGWFSTVYAKPKLHRGSSGFTNACCDQFPNIIAVETAMNGAAMVQNAAMGLIVWRYRYRPMLPPMPTAHPAKRSQRRRLNA